MSHSTTVGSYTMSHKSTTVGITKLPHCHTAPLQATEQAAAYDLHAAQVASGYFPIPQGQRRVIPTGITLQLPPHICAQVLSRSGKTLNHGLIVANAPGLIDPDYQGEVGVILEARDKDYKVEPGERIAQLLFTPIVHPALGSDSESTAAQRGAGGFGSTEEDQDG